MDEARMSKGMRRLIAISCTLLLAASVFLYLGVAVWAQEQPQPTEQPTGTEQQPAEISQPPTGAQPQPVQTSQGQGLTIDYWEPQVGTRIVYYVNDYLNDLHGDWYDTSTLGYWDAATLYATENPPLPISFASPYYRSVEAASDINACWFDLQGPWYVNLTTPYKMVDEVIGINDAPDAVHFPQATYAVRRLVIGSGGHRVDYVIYMSNDPGAKEWHEWGYSVEYVPPGSTGTHKEVVPYLSPYDKGMPVSSTLRFPLSVGTTGAVIPAITAGAEAFSGTVEIVAEGKVTVPGGTYDALLMKYEYNLPESRINATRIEYNWFVKDIGVVAGVKSLPNILGPTYEEATGYYSVRRDKIWYTSQGMWALESFAAPGQKQ